MRTYSWGLAYKSSAFLHSWLILSSSRRPLINCRYKRLLAAETTTILGLATYLVPSIRNQAEKLPRKGLKYTHMATRTIWSWNRRFGLPWSQCWNILCSLILTNSRARTRISTKTTKIKKCWRTSFEQARHWTCSWWTLWSIRCCHAVLTSMRQSATLELKMNW